VAVRDAEDAIIVASGLVGVNLVSALGLGNYGEQMSKALTAEIVVDGREPLTPALAPNGHLLCYVLAPVGRTGDLLDTEIWLVDTDGGAAPRRVTADTATESRPR
jgi:hypothetical protein